MYAPEPATPKTATRKSRARKPAGDPVLFDRDGLRAATAATAVLAGGPVRYGSDGHFWVYQDGVWIPGEDQVHARVVGTLGERYRDSHDRAIRGVMRAWTGRIDCKPVPQYINFTNGLLDWRTGELLPHTPDLPITVQLPIPWDESATCERFHAFLAEVLDPEDVNRVWEMTGYLMLSGNPLQRALMLTGNGGNGKGALLRTWIALLDGAAERNISNVALQALSENRFSAAQLFGKLANICGDIDNAYIEKTGLFKQMMGDDHVTAEHKYGQPFSFKNWATMVFSANEIPGAADASEGWPRRWEVVDFPREFPVPDLDLEPDIQAPESLAGIAVCAVSALRLLMDRRAFSSSAAGIAAKDELRRKANPVLVWLGERAAVDPDAFTPRTTAYADYIAWCDDENNRNPLQRRNFYSRLRLCHVAEHKSNGVPGFRLALTRTL